MGYCNLSHYLLFLLCSFSCMYVRLLRDLVRSSVLNKRKLLWFCFLITCKANCWVHSFLASYKGREGCTWLEKSRVFVICLLAVVTLINVYALIFTEGSWSEMTVRMLTRECIWSGVEGTAVNTVVACLRASRVSRWMKSEGEKREMKKQQCGLSAG